MGGGACSCYITHTHKPAPPSSRAGSSCIKPRTPGIPPDSSHRLLRGEFPLDQQGGDPAGLPQAGQKGRSRAGLAASLHSFLSIYGGSGAGARLASSTGNGEAEVIEFRLRGAAQAAKKPGLLLSVGLQAEGPNRDSIPGGRRVPSVDYHHGNRTARACVPRMWFQDAPILASLGPMPL